MSQCRGTTKAGERCKRSALEGGEYCRGHVDQAGADEAGPEPAAGRRGSRSGIEGSDAVVLIAAVAVAAYAVRKLFRLF